MLPVRVACQGLVLRPFRLDDAPRVALLCGEREVADMTSVIPHPYTEAMAREWITAQQGANAGEYTYAVTRRDDAALVGALGLRPDPAATDMVGYWIGKPYWGLGHATVALSAGLALAFGCLDVEVVHATHLSRNPASGRVMAKCGMRELRRESRAHRGGAAEPFCVRAITREEWEAHIAAS